MLKQYCVARIDAEGQMVFVEDNNGEKVFPETRKAIAETLLDRLDKFSSGKYFLFERDVTPWEKHGVVYTSPTEVHKA